MLDDDVLEELGALVRRDDGSDQQKTEAGLNLSGKESIARRPEPAIAHISKSDQPVKEERTNQPALAPKPLSGFDGRFSMSEGSSCSSNAAWYLLRASRCSAATALLSFLLCEYVAQVVGS